MNPVYMYRLGCPLQFTLLLPEATMATGAASTAGGEAVLGEGLLAFTGEAAWGILFTV